MATATAIAPTTVLGRRALSVCPARHGAPGQPQKVFAKVSQEMLAEMIGATRPRVNFFMNKFRKLGFSEYNGQIHVNHSLLSVVLHE